MHTPHVGGHKIPNHHPFSHEPHLDKKVLQTANEMNSQALLLGVQLPALSLWTVCFGIMLAIVLFLGAWIFVPFFGLGFVVCALCLGRGSFQIGAFLILSFFFPKTKRKIIEKAAQQR